MPTSLPDRLVHRSCLVAGLASLASVARPLAAQQPVTRAGATEAALSRGARAALGRADTAAAAGVLHAARLYPNPTVTASYTQDLPRYHLLATLPLDLPWLRAPRVGAARSAWDAARYSFAFERAAIRFDVDTAYTHALAARAHARLSRRTASDADTLLAMARLRRQVGDASELDVRLAEVNAGQLENAAADDSLTALQALVTVQLAMGLAAQAPTITLADTLGAPTDTLPAPPGEPLPVRAARAGLRSQERALTLARRSALPAPGLQAGFDAGDPAQRGGGLLPTIGVSLALPLFNWNGGEVRQARAARDRAQATLDLATRLADAERGRVERQRVAALARLARDGRLLASANRVAAMALQAYREGAVALPNVLETQRNAREALGRYIDDLAAANDAVAAGRLVAAELQ